MWRVRRLPNCKRDMQIPFSVTKTSIKLMLEGLNLKVLRFKVKGCNLHILTVKRYDKYARNLLRSMAWREMNYWACRLRYDS